MTPLSPLSGSVANRREVVCNAEAKREGSQAVMLNKQ
jgi:hypothetical protein